MYTPRDSSAKGSVAMEEAVPKAVANTLPMFTMNRKGSLRVKTPETGQLSSAPDVLQKMYRAATFLSFDRLRNIS
jgi:hypothetical protein